jgi:Helix-turn-helix domain
VSIHSCGLGLQPPARALYPIKEAEVLLAISHAQVYRLIASGKLDARKIGARSYITAESIALFLASLRKVGAA